MFLKLLYRKLDTINSPASAVINAAGIAASWPISLLCQVQTMLAIIAAAAGLARPTKCFLSTTPIWVLKRASRNKSEEHTSELQSRENLVCRLLLEKKKS